MVSSLRETVAYHSFVGLLLQWTEPSGFQMKIRRKLISVIYSPISKANYYYSACRELRLNFQISSIQGFVFHESYLRGLIAAKINLPQLHCRWTDVISCTSSLIAEARDFSPVFRSHFLSAARAYYSRAQDAPGQQCLLYNRDVIPADCFFLRAVMLCVNIIILAHTWCMHNVAAFCCSICDCSIHQASVLKKWFYISMKCFTPALILLKYC